MQKTNIKFRKEGNFMKKIILVLLILIMACSLGYKAQAQINNYVCIGTVSPFTVANSSWLMSNTAPNIYSLTTTIATAGYHPWWLLAISPSTTIAIPPNVNGSFP